MKKDWRYDRITQLKTTLGKIILAAESGPVDEKTLTDAKTVLNENRQLALAAEKAAKFEQF